MMKDRKIGFILLFIATIVWGSAFIFQSMVSEYLQPFMVNGIRFIIGALILLPIILFRRYKKGIKSINKKTIIYGIIIGSVLALASFLQQKGIELTSTAHAGFLTAMNIIFVPIISFFFLKTKIRWTQVLGIGLSIIGVGLLTLDNNFSINIGDLLCLLCGLVFAVQIILCGKFGKKSDGYVLSAISFFTCGFISLIIGLTTESYSNSQIIKALPYLIYLGVFSIAIGYTLQILGQSKLDETTSSLIMSLESVFCLIFGMIILHQFLSIKEIIGSIILFGSVIMVQVLNKDDPPKEDLTMEDKKEISEDNSNE